MLYSATLERQQQQGQNDMGMATAAKKKGWRIERASCCISIFFPEQ